MSSKKERLYKALMESGKPMGITEVCEWSGVDYKIASALLSKGVTGGELVRAGRGVYALNPEFNVKEYLRTGTSPSSREEPEVLEQHAEGEEEEGLGKSVRRLQDVVRAAQSSSQERLTRVIWQQAEENRALREEKEELEEEMEDLRSEIRAKDALIAELSKSVKDAIEVFSPKGSRGDDDSSPGRASSMLEGPLTESVLAVQLIAALVFYQDGGSLGDFAEYEERALESFLDHVKESLPEVYETWEDLRKNAPSYEAQNEVTFENVALMLGVEDVFRREVESFRTSIEGATP